MSFVGNASADRPDCDEYLAICGWLDNPAEGFGIRLADEDDGWTAKSYSEIAHDVRRIAADLIDNGLCYGGGVCIILPTDFLCISSMFAAWACDGSVTLVPPPVFGGGAEYEAHLGAILTQATPDLVVTSADLSPLVGRVMDDAGLAGSPVVLAEPAGTGDIRPAEPRPGVASSGCALVQFTSGSSGVPKGVRISWKNLQANTSFITDAVRWRPGEATVSWLPLYHDMGLIGGVLATVANQGDLYLMRPDQFIRDPGRWLRAMQSVQHSVSPSFGLGYAAARLERSEVTDLDLSGFRSLITGAEPIDIDHVYAFTELLSGTGYEPECLRPAYGLAESTLMATIAAADSFPAAVQIDGSALRFGRPVVIQDVTEYRGQGLSGGGWVVGLGGSTVESGICIVDSDGSELPEGTLGEVVIAGDSVAGGYQNSGGRNESADDSDSSAATRFVEGALYSGDAGFLRHNELFVLGRMGSSIKVRGKSVFMEDVDNRVARETGVRKQKIAAVAMQEVGATQGIVLFVEQAPGEWIDEARRVLRGELGPAQNVTIVTGGRGLIRRTSSGKPRRRLMWELFRNAELGSEIMIHGSVKPPEPEALVMPARRRSTALLSDTEIGELLERALESVEVPAESTFLLEGSIAEGFGNEGSDIDFLVVVPGSDPTPEMPTVLFIGARRVEVRTRSEDQLRGQLAYAKQVLLEDNPHAENLLDLNQDILNRCQRFLRAVVVRPGAPNVDELRLLLPDSDFSRVMTNWWFARGRESLRQSVAMAALDSAPEALDWARDGLLQVTKGWAAANGENYLETKWLGPQLERIGDEAVATRYFALDHALLVGELESGILDDTLEFTSELGVTCVPNDPEMVRLSRIRGVTSWPIDSRIHVLRDDQDVFVLSDRGARAWRSVVFGRSLEEILRRSPEPIHAEIAEFLSLGLVGLRWGREGSIRPATAMCKVNAPLTCPPAGSAPIIDIGGGARTDGQVATLSPLPARRFTECASALVWSNVIVENAREDLVGALKQKQGRVADVAADRLVKGVVRLLLSTLGCNPLPPDIAAVATLSRLIPAAMATRDQIIGQVRQAQLVSFTDLPEAGDDGLAVLDGLVESIRSAANLSFPASFNSHDQWRRTLEITYDWLRLAAYLDTELPIDEVQDLLASGGAQPHQRDRVAE